jgi:hypothetical protein
MRHCLILLLVSIGLGATSSAVTSTASAHRDPCHPKYRCPSDHASYRWRGLLCVKPTSSKRTSAFRKRVRYGGRTYFCKR